jgi:8-oxo-dGTP pyrophosphatase MutT (NUDIX family)
MALSIPGRRQVAALPVRFSEGRGEPQVLLITSRETRRWLVPKGWPIAGVGDAEAAAREAKQKAGVVGRISAHPCGDFTYFERAADSLATTDVSVFRLVVERELGRWKEAEQRERQWVSPTDAASLVQEPQLAAIILRQAHELPSNSRGYDGAF